MYFLQSGSLRRYSSQVVGQYLQTVQGNLVRSKAVIDAYTVDSYVHHLLAAFPRNH